MMRAILLVLLLLNYFSFLHAQDEVHYEDVSSSLSIGYYARICKGEELTVTLRNRSISTTNTHFKWATYSDCNPYYNLSVDYQEDNNSLKWEGNGIRRDFNDPNVIYVRPNASGTYTVSWQSIEFMPANACRTAYKKITNYFGTSMRLVVIPKPSPPSITADKATLRFPEATVIRTDGCPNTLLAENFPGSTSITQWAYGCDNDGNPTFNPNMAHHESLNFAPGYVYYGYGTASFYAKCNDNGCWSEDYSRTNLTLQASISADAEIAAIDEINAASGRSDYHKYETNGGKGKEICTIGPDNPNCTKQKVFELLLSAKDNQGPIAADFVHAGTLPNFWNWQQFGSNLLHSSDTDPISNGDIVNLPGGISLLAGAGSLFLVRGGLRGIDLRKILLGATLRVPQHIPYVANPIKMLVDNNSFSVTNYTMKGHWLYPGKVVRTVTEECGKIKVYTLGVGYNWVPDELSKLGLPGGEALGDFNAWVNGWYGPLLFDSIDDRFKQKFDDLTK